MISARGRCRYQPRPVRPIRGCNVNEIEAREAYARVCAEQAELRAKLLEVNVRKMSLAVCITRAVFGKSSGSGSPSLEEWRQRTEQGRRAATG